MTKPYAITLAEELEPTNPKAAAEVRRLYYNCESYSAALDEWWDKTEWVQSTTASGELGLHRADVLQYRIFLLENKILELTNRINKATKLLYE